MLGWINPPFLRMGVHSRSPVRQSFLRPPVLGLIFALACGGILAGDALLGQVLQPRTLQHPIIIDDGDSGFSANGAVSVSYPQAHLGDFRYMSHVGGQTVPVGTWNAGSLASGDYDVYATWVAFGSNSESVEYRLTSGEQTSTVRVDQRSEPRDAIYEETRWQLLGRVHVASDALSVSTPAAGRFSILDAVALVRVEEADTFAQSPLRASEAPPVSSSSAPAPEVIALPPAAGSSSSSIGAPSSTPYCGDGTVQGAEQCDDGNRKPGDRCDALCRRESCGDGIVTPALGEECDGGGFCSAECRLTYCGDGIVDAQLGETCDDGNVRRGDGCDEMCRTVIAEVPRQDPPILVRLPSLLTVTEQIIGSDVIVAGEKDVTLLHFEMRAGEGQDIVVTEIDLTDEAAADLAGLNAAIWMDTNQDGAVDLRMPIKQNGKIMSIPSAILIPATLGIMFEVRADVITGTSLDTLSIENVRAEGRDDAVPLDGTGRNGSCIDGNCRILITNVPVTKLTVRSQGSLFVTADSTPTPSRQLLGGALGDPVLRLDLRAQDEDVEVTYLQFSGLGDGVSSVDRLELFKEGQSTPFAIATPGGCYPAQATSRINGETVHAFCARMFSFQLQIANNQKNQVIVRPRMKSDLEGAVSGGDVRFFIAGAPVQVEGVERGAVHARGIISNNELVMNDGDDSATGEIFIGANTPGANRDIAGNTHQVVLSKIVSIVNASPDANGGNVPLGVLPVGQFRFSAGVNTNALNGLNDVRLHSMIFTVSSSGVSFEQNSFVLYNKADASQKASCIPVHPNNTTITADPLTGTFLVACNGFEATQVHTTFGAGATMTLVLEANIRDATTEAALQVSLRNFNNRGSTAYGPAASHVLWEDRDTGATTPFFWFNHPDGTVNGPQYRNGAVAASSAPTATPDDGCAQIVANAHTQATAWREHGPLRSTSDRSVMLFTEIRQGTSRVLKAVNTVTCDVTTLVAPEELDTYDSLWEVSIADNGMVLYATRGWYYQDGSLENIRGTLTLMDTATGQKTIIIPRAPANGDGDRAAISRDGQSVVFTASFADLDNDPATGIGNADGSRELFLWKNGVITQLTDFTGGPGQITNMLGAVFEDPEGRFISMHLDFDPDTRRRHERPLAISDAAPEDIVVWQSRLYLYDTASGTFHRLTDVQPGSRNQHRGAIDAAITQLRAGALGIKEPGNRLFSFFSFIGSLLNSYVGF